MKIYNQGQREQLSFWEALLDDYILDGRLFQFDVIRSAPLAQPAPLLQCSDRKLRGFVVSLEAGGSSWHHPSHGVASSPTTCHPCHTAPMEIDFGAPHACPPYARSCRKAWRQH